MTALAVRRFPSRTALDEALAERLTRTIAAPSTSALMLAGGESPLPAYRTVSARVPAHTARLRILYSDERYVPADAAASNYRRARVLTDALALPAGGVLRVRTELPLAEAAADYERTLSALLATGVRTTLGLLGLGADGHTASLFSAADLERAEGRLAIAVSRPDGMSAVSVTPRFLASVAELLFVIAGPGKEEALARLAAGDPQLIAWRAVQECASVAAWVDATP